VCQDELKPEETLMNQDCVDQRIVMGFISVPEKEAHGLAQKLVLEKLVSCAQITGGITSYYWWEGEVKKEGEVLVIIKTKFSLQQAVSDFVQREHSYDVPECVFTPVSGGICSYLQWVCNVTK
jgi:periplasmic divalent cation tolerance protein